MISQSLSDGGRGESQKVHVVRTQFFYFFPSEPKGHSLEMEHEE